MIKIKGVTKYFKEKKQTIAAVQDIHVTIAQGEIVGLLGENGAGKTTLLRMLSTVLEPSEGNMFIHGINIHKQPDKIKQKIGVLFGGETGLYDRLTARENLAYFAKFYGMSKHETKIRIEELAKRFGMKEYLDRRVGGFSKGMRQKVAIARTILHNPDVILFDEPTTGLDITSANMFRELIKSLQREGKTIIFSSHIMEEVEMLCQSIIMIHKGKMIYQGTNEQLYKEEESTDLNYIFMSRIVRGLNMIWHIYKKELIDCFRDRKTIIFSVLIPILLNVGIILFVDKMMASDQTDSMSVAVTKGSDASVIDWLKNDDSIKVIESKNPLSAVEEGNALAALKLSDNFSSEVLNMKSPEVTIYTDEASMNSSATAEYIQNILNKHREAIVSERLNQLNVNSQTIAPFNVIEKGLSKDDDGSLTMIAMFAPMIIIMGVLGGFFLQQMIFLQVKKNGRRWKLY